MVSGGSDFDVRVMLVPSLETVWVNSHHVAAISYLWLRSDELVSVDRNRFCMVTSVGDFSLVGSF